MYCMFVYIEHVYHRNLLLSGHSSIFVTKLNSINFTLHYCLMEMHPRSRFRHAVMQLGLQHN
jgi:hypothetical protein